MGKTKPDSYLRNYERKPLETDINEYYNTEAKSHLPDILMDRTKDKIGYEINFTKYFYKNKLLRSVEEITKELLELEKESDGLMKDLLTLPE